MDRAQGTGQDSPDNASRIRMRSPMVEFLAVIMRRRRLLLWFCAAGFVIGIAIALLSPARYTTSFSFTPQSESDGARSGLASLAGQFGVSLGAGTGQSAPPQFYADLLVTRELLAPIALDSVPSKSDAHGQVPLSRFLDVDAATAPERQYETIRRLRDDVISTSVAERTTGVVSVNVRTTSAAASLAIAQRLLDGLSQFNLVTRQSQATAERRFIEGRLSAAKVELTDSETQLRRFLETNRAIANSPALQFELDRLRRDETMKEDLVRTLTQQYEQARIREVRDTPVITLIDRPTLAARSDPRGRGRIVLGATTIALILALAIVLTEDRLRRELEDHHVTSLRALARQAPMVT